MSEIVLMDMLQEYKTDMVDCYEKPLAHLLGYINPRYTSLYILLQKMFQSYEFQEKENIDDYIQELFQVDIKYSSDSNSILSSIRHYIEQGYPVLLTGDLYELFYSDYYHISHWPHWFIITQYDDSRELCKILDDTHCGKTDSEYREFYLTYEILEKMNESFLKNLNKRQGMTAIIPKNNNILDYKVILEKILKIYVDEVIPYKVTIYSQNTYLTELLKTIIVNVDLRKKESHITNIMRINKYKFVAIKELSKNLEIIGYDKPIQDELEEINNQLLLLWNNFSMKNIFYLFRNKTLKRFPNQLLEIEERLYEIIFELYYYLCSINEKNEKYLQNDEYEEKQTKQKEDLVQIDHNAINFCFFDGELHNWWLEDNCPKYTLYRGVLQQDNTYIIRTKFHVDKNCEESQFQFGIYIKTFTNELRLENSYFTAVDGAGKFVFDIIGVSNDNIKIDATMDGTLTMIIKGEKLIGELMKEDKYNKQINKFFCWAREVEIGFACKTWGNGKCLKVSFYDYQFLEDNIKFIDKGGTNEI